MAGQTLGFIGTGRMGGPMVARLLDAGHAVAIYDISDEAMAPLLARGALRAASPAALASEVETVMTSLPTPEIVERVTFGENGIAAGTRVKTVIDLSTIGPSMVRELAPQMLARGIQWVDSPVSGGVAGAIAGTLAVMVACPKPAYEEIQPLVAVFGKTFYVGEEPGLAQVVKLGNNLLSAAALVLSAEALAFGVKAGVDPRVMVEIINAGSGRNSATQDKFPKNILPGTFDAGFATGLSYKDTRLCLEEAETLGAAMVAGEVVRRALAETAEKYGLDSDFTCIAKVIESRSGVAIRDKAKR